jgi:hypothetical protein
MNTFRFEEGLSTLFQAGRSVLTLLALAERSGLSHRAQDWLGTGRHGKPRRKLAVGTFGKRWIKEITPFWEILRNGSARDIDDNTRTFAGSSSDTVTLEIAFNNLVMPLTLLDRADVLATLHDQLLERGVAISRRAAVTLAEVGEWEHALAILESAHRHDPDLGFGVSIQDRLWKYAYLQGLTESVLPRLAAIPFDRSVPHAKELRAWWLKTHQIRAGRSAVLVPVIDRDKQPPGYVETAATQIAALATDPSKAKMVGDLRRVLKPGTLTMELPQHGVAFSVDKLSPELFKAEARIAARRKDHDRAAELAQSSAYYMFAAAPDIVIDAFLEEGDWRGAAAIAARHDPRNRPLPFEGLADERLDEYRSLQRALAGSAARSGDDAAARSFLVANARTYNPEASLLDLGRIDPWSATTLAAAEEGALPRRLLALLLPPLRL